MISSIIKAANENDHYVVPIELGETFLIAEFDSYKEDVKKRVSDEDLLTYIDSLN